MNKKYIILIVTGLIIATGLITIFQITKEDIFARRIRNTCTGLQRPLSRPPRGEYDRNHLFPAYNQIIEISKSPEEVKIPKLLLGSIATYKRNRLFAIYLDADLLVEKIYLTDKHDLYIEIPVAWKEELKKELLTDPSFPIFSTFFVKVEWTQKDAILVTDINGILLLKLPEKLKKTKFYMGLIDKENNKSSERQGVLVETLE